MSFCPQRSKRNSPAVTFHPTGIKDRVVSTSLPAMINLLSIALAVLIFVNTVESHDVNFHHLKDSRLCNNVDVGHNRHVCKVRAEPDLEAGDTFPCDTRKLSPEQCTVAVIESTALLVSNVFDLLPSLDQNHNIRRIIIKFNTSESIDFEQLGNSIDNFLASRLWWYVTKEPHTWLPQSMRHPIVLSKVQHQFEPALKVLSALQYPTSQEICKKSPLVLHHRDFKHPGWFSMLAQYSSVHEDFPNAITGVYVSSANSVNDSTSFVSAEDCPHKINKWECAFLPVTNCSLPTSVTHCNKENCVVSGVADNRGISAVYDSATEDGQIFKQNTPEYEAEKSVSTHPLTFNEKFMEASAELAKSPPTNTKYGKPHFPELAPFHRMMFSPINHYVYDFLLRPTAFYRSRIAEAIHHFHESTGFSPSQRCVAAQIRRGDRAAANLNITEFCKNPANKDSDYGCATVPFASVTLQHVVDSAEKLVDDSVRSLIVTTDDEEWLEGQRVELRKTRPNWRIYSMKTPDHSHAPSHSVPPPEVALSKGDPEYKFMRYGAGTASGVLLHGSVQLSRQCEAFVGHFGCGGTLLVYKALCAQSNHMENVCPPAFDVREIKELQVLKHK